MATAVPITDVFAHVPLWNCTGPHALLSFFRSRPSIGGSATSATAVEPWPSGTVITAFSGGNEPTLVLPRAPSVASSLGENASPAQSVAAYGADTVATVPPTPVSVARTACSAQLDALRMNPGRSSVSVNDRIDTGTPPISRGSGDVCTVRPPSGRSLIDAITVTVPRSTGPTLPGRTIWNPARPPSCGPVRIHVAVERDRRVTRARHGGHAAHARPDRQALQRAGEARRQVRLHLRDVLRAVGARDLHRHRPGRAARRGGGRGHLQPGRERRQRAALVDREARGHGLRRGPAPGRERGAERLGPARRRVVRAPPSGRRRSSARTP